MRGNRARVERLARSHTGPRAQEESRCGTLWVHCSTEASTEARFLIVMRVIVDFHARHPDS